MSTIYQIQTTAQQHVGNILCVRLPEFDTPYWYVCFHHSYRQPGKLCPSLDAAAAHCQAVLGKGHGRLTAAAAHDVKRDARSRDLQSLAETLQRIVHRSIRAPADVS